VSYDQTARLRRRAYRADRLAVSRGELLDRALRMLGILAEIAAGIECDPLELLAVVEQIDERMQAAARWTPAAVAELFRETAA
jgi:hypothetical protein